jgi:ParB family chromosome partitioning protein
VRDFSDAETMEIALIENVQRQDLNPVEEAEAYSRLIAQFGHSQEVLGKLVGKSRSHVANLMRLLDLPASVLDIVRGGQLSMGHARALIGVDGAAQIARQVVAKGLSVRQVEKLAQKAKGRTPAATEKGARAGAAARDADIVALEQHLADLIGVKVSIDHSAQGSGTLSLRYSTLDQLDMLCQRLSGDAI